MSNVIVDIRHHLVGIEICLNGIIYMLKIWGR